MNLRDRLYDPSPLLLDGGLATQLEAQGCDLNNPLWSASLLLERPEEIIAASRAFVDAGAECIATASYQASREGFAERGLSGEESDKLMLLSVDLARRAAGDSGALVAASIGPYGAMLHDGSEYSGDYAIRPEGALSADALRRFHEARLRLFDASLVDALACETIPSLPEADVLAELLADCDTPAWISFSCRDGQHISDGTRIEDAAALFGDHPTVLAVGVNCTAPQYVTELVTRIRGAVPDKAVIAYPNSGETWNADDGTWSGTSTPLDFASAAADWVAAGARIVGGCCRTGPEHIRAMAEALTHHRQTRDRRPG